MRSIFWNCRGFARAAAVQALRDMLRQHSPDISFLEEIVIIGVCHNLQHVGFDHFFECPPRRKRGGLALVWKQGAELDVSFVNHHILTVVLYSDPCNQPWMISFVHGPTNWNEKDNF